MERISEETCVKMNSLATKCFELNAEFDNLAYSLEYNYLHEIAYIIHYHVAHIMPEFADLITDKMLELSVRPVRQNISGYGKEYTNALAAFISLRDAMYSFRSGIKDLIYTADMNEDDEARIFAEELLNKVSLYIKQSEEWVSAAQNLTDHEMNIHIKEYTHFIEI